MLKAHRQSIGIAKECAHDRRECELMPSATTVNTFASRAQGRLVLVTHLAVPTTTATDYLRFINAICASYTGSVASNLRLFYLNTL